MSAAPSTHKERRHILTVNVEDYYQVGAFRDLIQQNHWERFDARLKINVEATLQLLQETGNQATFFTSGWIAKNHPELLRTIAKHGHEIACQGYHQQSIRDLPPEAFQEDVKRSKQTVEDAIGIAVNGFRIGRGWIGPSDLWALEILHELELLYDSSLCPIGKQFATEDFRLRLHQHRLENDVIWEVPVSAARWMDWAIPFSGGNYVRQLPSWPVREAAARWVERREAPLVMYFHIWEIDAEQPNISAASWLQKMRHYRNLERMRERMHYFLTRYPFTSVESYLGFMQHRLSERNESLSEAVVQPTIQITRNTEQFYDLTVVIPCYNEESSLIYLKHTLEKLVESAADLLQLSFIFVDDGSTDRTRELLSALFGGKENTRIVHHQKNMGIGRAIITGFEHVDTEYVAVIDADCTFDPLDLPSMIQQMGSNTAAIAASPFHQRGNVANVPRWRLGLSRGAALLYRLVLHHKFSGYTSCFRIYKTSAISDMEIYNNGFCGVTEIFARLDLAGKDLMECPAELQIRLLGESKINLIRTTIDHLILVARLAGLRWFNIALPSPNSDSDST